MAQCSLFVLKVWLNPDQATFSGLTVHCWWDRAHWTSVSDLSSSSLMCQGLLGCLKHLKIINRMFQIIQTMSQVEEF